ncbi:unnamed protein product [Paramecium primaurelia]|uniref:Uncharacterized protein n=1 Tax=Paramecium primaurelia TaxID=5886 RepID=A0A8S1P3I1_PARPR|nr:unnamed protein product [Paramecium primaurelia]
MLSMQNIEDTTSLNWISSDEEEYLESSLKSPIINQKVQEIKQQVLDQCEVEVPIDQISIEISFKRHINQRINDTAVLQHRADEITQKIMKNVKGPFQRDYLKEIVSISKKRFKVDDFNLDLTFKQIITNPDIEDNLIAMGIPTEIFEAIYRNPMSEVQKILKYTSSQQLYGHQLHEYFYKMAEFPFEDHQALPFNLIVDFCTIVAQLVFIQTQKCYCCTLQGWQGKNRNDDMLLFTIQWQVHFKQKCKNLLWNYSCYKLKRSNNPKLDQICSLFQFCFQKMIQQIDHFSWFNQWNIDQIIEQQQIINRKSIDYIREGSSLHF